MADLEIIRFRLAELLESGWTQGEISYKSGISQPAISKMSRGKTSRLKDATTERMEAFLNRQDVQDTLSEDALSEEDARKAIRLFKFFRQEIQNGSQILLRTPGMEDRHLVVLL